MSLKNGLNKTGDIGPRKKAEDLRSAVGQNKKLMQKKIP